MKNLKSSSITLIYIGTFSSLRAILDIFLALPFDFWNKKVKNLKNIVPPKAQKSMKGDKKF